MKFKLIITLLLISFSALAQKTTISGVVSDKELNGEPLPFANVVIKGKSLGVTTDIDGKYSLEIPAGSHIVVFSFLGYESKEILFTIAEGENKTFDVTLGTGSVTLEDVVIKATVSREKESALLLEQKKSVEIKQSIGAQEMSRKGVSDVAGAVTKTTGITKQEGTGNIFVRGLSDRYNSTTMNGLPIPSNDPEKKNINLEIFSTDILEFVSIDKVYNSKLFGDFAGGNVDIVSKDYKGKGLLRLDAGSKINTNALSNNDFTLLKGYSPFGFDARKTPQNALSSYKFKTLNSESYTPVGGSFGVTVGDSYDVGSNGSKLNFFATASFSNDYTSKNNGLARGGVNEAGVINKDFEKYSSIAYTTTTNVMGTLGYKINDNHKLNFNSVLINSSSLSKDEYYGYIVDIANNGNGFIRRNKFEKNTLWINQLLGNHTLSEKTKANWGISYNTIKGDMPDRTQNTLRKESNGYVLSAISAPDNHRYFQELKENELAGNAAIDYKFKKNDEGDYNGKFTLGFNGRYKTRDFAATQFNLKTNSNFTGEIVDINNLDGFYNQNNFNNGYFNISTFRGNAQVTNAEKPQVYNGEQVINGGYLNTEYNFGKLTAVVGLRGEYIFQKIKWNTQLDPSGNKDELEKVAFLPSATLKYSLNEKHNLRLGVSKTYTLPQFKERALFIYEEVNEVKVGNPDLYASDDYNADLKWEYFPKNDEVISVTAFAKYIKNPMNEVTIASSTNDISFINTGDYGYVAGAEAEVRKQIFATEDRNKLTTGLNVSYLYSDQELSTNKVIRETNYNVVFTDDKSKFTGASDLLVNADVTFFNEWKNKENNLTTTLAYNYFSDRVYALGTNGRGNLVDKAVGTVDFISKAKFGKHFGVGIVAKNLLNPTIDRVQENKSNTVKVLSYDKGTTFSLNFSYTF